MSIFKTFKAETMTDLQLYAVGHLLLRADDMRELEASSGKPSGDALIEAVHACKKSYLTFTNEGLVALFGIHESQIGGVIWFVGTDLLYDCIKEFNKVSKIIIDNWLNKYGCLFNYIDSRNKSHLRWLEHLGFTFPGTHAVMNGVEFKYFYKEKAHV